MNKSKFVNPLGQNRFVSSSQSFPVRSLGWVEMAEHDLCEGRSSLAVHHCIRQLSYCRRDIRDSAGVWGEVSVLTETDGSYNIQYTNECSPSLSQFALFVFNVQDVQANSNLAWPPRLWTALVYICGLTGQRDAAGASRPHVDPGGPRWSQPASLSANQQHPCLGGGPRPRQVGGDHKCFSSLMQPSFLLKVLCGYACLFVPTSLGFEWDAKKEVACKHITNIRTL